MYDVFNTQLGLRVILKVNNLGCQYIFNWIKRGNVISGLYFVQKNETIDFSFVFSLLTVKQKQR